MHTADRSRTLAASTAFLLVFALVAAPGTSPPGVARAQQSGARVTYLYDNTEAVPGVQADWGFACLVEGHGRRVLFDTGTKPEVLRHNAEALHVDLGRMDAVVLSHDHSDHVAGFPALGKRPGLPVFYAQGFDAMVVGALRESSATLVPVSKSVDVGPGLRTSDEFGTAIKEEALIIDTPDGLVVVVGCSHPGIVTMLRQIKTSTGRPIHTVLGGFHLLETPADEVERMVSAFQELGIVRVGPTHCTGPDAIRLFRYAYGNRCVAGGVGTVVAARQ